MGQSPPGRATTSMGGHGFYQGRRDFGARSPTRASSVPHRRAWLMRGILSFLFVPRSGTSTWPGGMLHRSRGCRSSTLFRFDHLHPRDDAVVAQRHLTISNLAAPCSAPSPRTGAVRACSKAARHNGGGRLSFRDVLHSTNTSTACACPTCCHRHTYVLLWLISELAMGEMRERGGDCVWRIPSLNSYCLSSCPCAPCPTPRWSIASRTTSKSAVAVRSSVGTRRESFSRPLASVRDALLP